MRYVRCEPEQSKGSVAVLITAPILWLAGSIPLAADLNF